jgi:hypothetical protein
MIETPLFGRFYGENKRLVFSAPLPYQVLVKGSLFGGAGMVLYGFLEDAIGGGPLWPEWWKGIGILVIAAGIAAACSLTSITFILGERQYRRRQGPGLFESTKRGSTAELDAIVLITEPNSRLLPNGITYHLVLHWKGQAQPIMVLQSDSRMHVPGQPLNIGAQQLLQQGLRYSQALGIPFFDNSHFASKCPVPIWK